MFVCGLPFFVTLLRKIQLVTAEYMPNRKAGQLAKSLRKIVNLYTKGGFIVRLDLMNNAFDKIENLVGVLETNTTEARESVGKNRKGNQADQKEDKVYYDRISLP